MTRPARSGCNASYDSGNAETGALETRFDASPASYRAGVRVAVEDPVGGGPSAVLVPKLGQRQVEVFTGQTGTLVSTFSGVVAPGFRSGRFAPGRTPAWHLR